MSYDKSCDWSVCISDANVSIYSGMYSNVHIQSKPLEAHQKCKKKKNVKSYWVYCERIVTTFKNVGNEKSLFRMS